MSVPEAGVTEPKARQLRQRGQAGVAGVELITADAALGRFAPNRGSAPRSRRGNVAAACAGGNDPAASDTASIETLRRYQMRAEVERAT
jgi:hypothetical protein